MIRSAQSLALKNKDTLWSTLAMSLEQVHLESPATNSVLWHMGDDIPNIPNKRDGGFVLGG